MTNNTDTKPTYEAFPLSEYFKHRSLGVSALRIVSISEDGYFNVRADLPTGPAFVSIFEGEAFRVSSAQGDDDGLAFLKVRHAGSRDLSGTVEADGVMVAAVPPTNLVYRDKEDEHAHPNTLDGHRTIGCYTVCDAAAEYWVS